MKPQIQVVADSEQLSRTAAAEFLRQAREAVRTKDAFAVALSGGTTPRSLYRRLADDSSLRGQLPWEKAHFFWGDERHVSPDHADSNYRMADEAMLSRVPVPSGNVHRIKGEYHDARRAAEEYEEVLGEFFRLSPGQFPRFDLVLLGLGPEGHTASLFPGTMALREHERLVVSNWIGKFDADRITMTAPVLNNADCVIFLVSGEEKALILKAVLQGRHEPEQLPAQLIRPNHGRLLWLVDRAAARLLHGDREPEVSKSGRDV
jgi:6-phosphogluconolactonase